MNQKALRVLEYDKVIALLMEQATSDSGRELCKNLLPITDRLEISRRTQPGTGGGMRACRPTVRRNIAVHPVGAD